MRENPETISGYLLDMFDRSFLNEERCQKTILNLLHPNGPACPFCKTRLDEKKFPRFANLHKIKCKKCNKFFTGLTGTMLSGTHLTFAQLTLLAVLIESGIRPEKIEKITKIHRETVILWKKKL
ncbi:MAG: transposase [Proteobacteria bacterium]|nr:transposase [Pseudomonadota bacterium]